MLMGGLVGGLDGISGGSILAPILVALWLLRLRVAPATLAATSLTSIAAFQVLRAVHADAIVPQWILSAFLGAGRFAGSYCGARLRSRLHERNLRRLLGLIACLVAARYILTAATSTTRDRGQPGTHTQPDRRQHPNGR